MSTCGIHFVWTTYGTWLPGDERGHWSPLYDLYGSLRAKGHRLNLPDHMTRRIAQERMLESPKVLSANEIERLANLLGSLATSYSPAFTPVNSSPILSDAMKNPSGIGASFGPFEQPVVLAAAIEPTHIHLLTGPLKQDIAAFAGRLKGATSSALLKQSENCDRKRIWTSGYWKVFLFDEPAVICVKDYIERHNERRGMPSAPYDWIGFK